MRESGMKLVIVLTIFFIHNNDLVINQTFYNFVIWITCSKIMYSY